MGAVTLGQAVASQSPKWESGQEIFFIQHPSQRTWGVSIAFPPDWTYVGPMYKASCFLFLFPPFFLPSASPPHAPLLHPVYHLDFRWCPLFSRALGFRA